jgi:hypothetical protein
VSLGEGREGEERTNRREHVAAAIPTTSPAPLAGMASPVPVVVLDLQGSTNMILEYPNNVI